ncbi:Amf1p [Sugiyamaella lignohabitans]|uniref:Amf1p n=1 Tax=Sugiyamaella lignohabitans TaxID=796027 RepID=A0A161HK49_9ASCO|nr:Amf1p [Sugiyamaella lignohabitans]ANB13277.1 Amf1p [Sugiyamaella lignohabitans]
MSKEASFSGEDAICASVIKDKPVSPMGVGETDGINPRTVSPTSFESLGEPSNSSVEKHGDDRPPNMSLLHELAFVGVIISSQIVTQVGVGQGLAPMKIVGEHFGQYDAGKLSWYVAAYSLTVGTFIIACGRAGDMYSHKKLFLFGYAWLSLWALLSGISSYSNSVFFDICRGLQGIGPAFLLPNGLAILGRAYHTPGRRKHLAFASFGAVAPFGCCVGAIFAALFAQLVKIWALAYYVMAGVGLLMTIASYFVIPDEDKEEFAREAAGQKFDYYGAIAGIGGLILINVAWNQGPVVGWQVPYVYILLIIGFLFMAAFIVIELTVAQPLIPLKEMSPATIRILSTIALGWATFGIWLVYLWSFCLDVRHESPIEVGVQFLPTIVAGFCAAGLTAFLFGRHVEPTVMMVIALIGFCIPSILLATMPVHQTYWSALFVSFLIAPFGMDISFPTATIMLSNAVPRNRQGIAGSLVATVVNYAISIGLGIAGTVVRQLSPGQDPQSLLHGIRIAAYVGVGLSGAGIVLALIEVFLHRKVPKGL